MTIRTTARRLLGEWSGESAAEFSSTEIARVAIEQGLLASHRLVFGAIAWFVVLGPAGAILYRASEMLAAQWVPARGLGRRVRPLRRALLFPDRLDSGARDRAHVRGRRQFRGRGLLLAQPGRRVGRPHAGRHPGRRAAARSASVWAIPCSSTAACNSGRSWASAAKPMSTRWKARSASSGARSCCGCSCCSSSASRTRWGSGQGGRRLTLPDRVS